MRRLRPPVARGAARGAPPGRRGWQESSAAAAVPSAWCAAEQQGGVRAGIDRGELKRSPATASIAASVAVSRSMAPTAAATRPRDGADPSRPGRRNVNATLDGAPTAPASNKRCELVGNLCADEAQPGAKLRRPAVPARRPDVVTVRAAVMSIGPPGAGEGGPRGREARSTPRAAALIGPVVAAAEAARSSVSMASGLGHAESACRARGFRPFQGKRVRNAPGLRRIQGAGEVLPQGRERARRCYLAATFGSSPCPIC